MTIAICGSLHFYKEMRLLEKQLNSMGHRVFVPKSFDFIEREEFSKPKTIEERLRAEKKFDFIREHFRQIEQSDAILVANYDKDGMRGYVGGNTFLEMGIAFYLGKKIYFLNPIPDMECSKLEMRAMKPIILNGDLSSL